MTTCEFCEQNWYSCNGCLISSIEIEGESRPRIPYTPLYFGPDYENCIKCNAKFGRYHHPWCEKETCPNCTNQLISCDCRITGLLKGIGPIRANEQFIIEQFEGTIDKLTDNGNKQLDQNILRTELLKLEVWNGQKWDNDLVDMMLEGWNGDWVVEEVTK